MGQIKIEKHHISRNRRQLKQYNSTETITNSSSSSNSNSSGPYFPNNNSDAFGWFKLKDYQDMQYVARMTIGTPSQSVKIMIDSGSSQCWVFSIGSSTYQASQSSSAHQSQQQQQIIYGKGAIQGVLGTELFGINSIGLYDVKMNMIFVQQEEDMSDSMFDGLMGVSNDNQYRNILEVAHSEQKMKDSMFAFALNDEDKTTYFYAGSQSLPQNVINDANWIGLTRNNYWAVGVQAVETMGVNSTSVADAVIDSGTSELLISSDAFSNFANGFPSQCQVDLFSRSVICPCDQSNFAQYPSLKFYISGTVYQLLPEDYIVQSTNQDGQCAVAIQDLSTINNVPFMILGDVFMRKYTIIYDKDNQKLAIYNHPFNNIANPPISPPDKTHQGTQAAHIISVVQSLQCLMLAFFVLIQIIQK